MSNKIIVFGATGGTASNIALDLAAHGYEVIAVGRRKSDNGFFADYSIPYLSVDITDKDDFKKLPQEGVGAVVHYAGVLPSFMKQFDNQPFISTIVQGTYNVLEYMRQAGIGRIIFPQSLFDVHHLFGRAMPIPADAERRVPDGDHAMYVIAKNMAIDMIEMYHKLYGMQRFIIRMSRIYLYSPNPYWYEFGVQKLYSDRYLIYQAMKGRDIEIWGDPQRVLETMCVKDLCQLIRCALAADVEGGIYNVGSGGTTLENRIRGIVDVFSPKGQPSQIIYRPDKPNGTQFLLDYSKSTKELGYYPEYDWIKYLCYFKDEMVTQRFHKLWGYEKDYFDFDKF